MESRGVASSNRLLGALPLPSSVCYAHAHSPKPCQEEGDPERSPRGTATVASAPVHSRGPVAS